MKLSLVLTCIALATCDLIGFNRYYNNVARHTYKTTNVAQNPDYFLQIVLYEIKKGDIQTAKRMIEMLEDNNDKFNDVRNWKHGYNFDTHKQS